MIRYLVFSIFMLTGILVTCYGYADKVDSLNLRLAHVEGLEKAKVLYLLAEQFVSSNPEMAADYLKEAQAIIDKNPDNEAQAFICKYRSSLAEQETLGSGLDDLRKAIELFRLVNNYHETAWCCRRMGIFFFQLGNYDKALSYFIMSQQAFEKEGFLKGIEAIENNLGAVHYTMGNLEEALKHYNRALELNLKTKDTIIFYKVKTNIGLLYQADKKYDEALALFREAEEGFLKNKDDNGLTSAYNNMALAYYSKGDLNKAIQYQRKALQFAERSNSQYSLSTSLVNLGAIYNELGKRDSALYFIQKGSLLADSLGFKDIYYESLVETANVYAARGDYKKAYSYQSDAFTLNEEIAGQQVLAKIAELSVSHEQELKEQEFERMQTQNDLKSVLNKILILLFILVLVIFVLTRINLKSNKRSNELLREKNEQLNDFNKQLKESEETLKTINSSKDRLFSIVAHDLRNPIAAVSGFSELLSTDYDHLNDETRKEYILQIIQGVNRTQTLLENLLIWSRSQMKAIRYQPDFFPVCTLTDDAVKPLKLNFEQKKIRTQVDCKRNFDVYADREMALTILRNLLMNAIKFSFPGGQIEIKVECDEHTCTIAIADHGIGIQPELQEKLLDKGSMVHSTPGTSGESGSGLGMAICLEFAEINHGKISVDSIPGKGSTFYLSLPMDIPLT